VSGFHLAQVNIGRLVAPIGDDRVKEFRENLPRINALAEAQPGFVWRATGEGDDATDIQPYEADPTIAFNASVWESPEHLAAFAYRTDHRLFVRRRAEWFLPMREAFLVLWWVPAGHRPSLAECLERLEHLRAHGPTPHAFDLRSRFLAPVPETAE
jgi:hypothetical protein